MLPCYIRVHNLFVLACISKGLLVDKTLVQNLIKEQSKNCIMLALRCTF